MTASLRALAAALRTGAPVPALPPLRQTQLALAAGSGVLRDETDLMVDSVNTMAALLATVAARPDGMRHPTRVGRTGAGAAARRTRGLTYSVPTTRAVVLARGLGSRMRVPDPGAEMTAEQAAAADAGAKAMMPVHGRPFLDYVISALADAGITAVALIVAPEHARLRQHYDADAPPARVAVSFVVQPDAVGTANAVLAAETWTAGEPFLAMNADNLYPVPALRDLTALDGPGLPAFEADDLVRSGNIPAERIRAFALVQADALGFLTGIVEKPGGDAFAAPDHAGQPARLVSMNCWRFDERIFPACRDVPRSARGEFELPEAVGLAVRRGVRFAVRRARGPVLDLSTRADAAEVAARLAGAIPCP